MNGAKVKSEITQLPAWASRHGCGEVRSSHDLNKALGITLEEVEMFAYLHALTIAGSEAIPFTKFDLVRTTSPLPSK